MAFVPHVASELNRMLERQKELDPGSVEYSTLLRNIEVLVGTADLYVDIMEYLSQSGLLNDESKIVDVTVAPEFIEAVKDSFRPGTGETEEAASEKVLEFPAVTYDLVTVRAALRDAKKRGVDIAGLIKSFGASNLTDLPEEKYGDLMKKLEE